MLKKAKADARGATSSSFTSSKEVAQSVLDSSRQIWLAGLSSSLRRHITLTGFNHQSTLRFFDAVR